MEIKLLGSFEVCLAGHPVDCISYARMRALLAYLAVEREQDHSRSFLAALLWNGANPETARGNLRRTLSHLRRALESPTGKTLFLTSKHTIRFVPHIYVDVLNFSGQSDDSNEEGIIDLYRGEFMSGFSLPDCPDFEDWLLTQREAFHRRMLTSLEKLANRHEHAGDYGNALQFAMRYIELEPWLETGHRRAMRLLVLNGQAKAATALFDTYCRLLKTELGILPDVETRLLAEHIRNGKSGQRATDYTTMPQQNIQLPAEATVDMPVRYPDNAAAIRIASHAEWRQVTVLYAELVCEMVNDAEEEMRLLHTTQDQCAKIIRPLSGHVVQTHGSTLLAYFGYPTAHEDAARYAIQAALTMAGIAIPAIKIRAGVHTGLIITNRSTSMPDIVGKTSRLAALLCQNIALGEVAINQETRAITGGYFEYNSLGDQFLPGYTLPVEILSVIRGSGARNRLEAATLLTPFIGREAEIARLMAMWEEVIQGTSCVTLIQGEPGIGKSRLLHALKKKLAGQSHIIRELRCFPEFRQSPFYPIIAVLEAFFGFERDDTPESKSGKLAQRLEALYPTSNRDAIALLSILLCLPLVGQHKVPDFSPQKQKEQIITVLLALFQDLAAQQPLLFIVEDLHWIDHSTLELLTLFVEQTKRYSVLTVLTARPEFDPPWNESFETALALAPLANEDVAKMVTSINVDIPPETVRHIVERADGVPLFAEEMAKIANLDYQTAIPSTLRDLLIARLDSMGEAKYTAQLAACIGRRFDMPLLSNVSLCDAKVLTHHLKILHDEGLISHLNETSFKFKHALIQEAAYQSQTKDNRQSAHNRIAQALLNDYPEIVANQPEVIALHFSSGGEAEQAIEYWIKAALRSSRNSANLEAIELFNSALQQLMILPCGPDRDREEFKIMVKLSSLLSVTHGYSSSETTQAYARISVLSNLVGENQNLFQANWALVLHSVANAGPLEGNAIRMAMQLLDIAHDDPLKKMAAHHAVADVAFWLGEFETTRRHAEQALGLYHPSQHQMLVEQFGANLSVLSATYLSGALYFLGYPDSAQQVCERLLMQARDLSHPYTLAAAIGSAALLHRWQNECTGALTLSDEAVAIARQHDFAVWIGLNEITYGWAQVMHNMPDGVTKIKSGIRTSTAAIGGISTRFLYSLIYAYMHLKKFAEALEILEECQIEPSNATNSYAAAEINRLKGICLLEIIDKNEDEAEACFQQAINISRRQGAKSLELRAATSLSRLWCLQGRQVDAQHLLENLYNWFSEGFDTPDLLNARSLLDSFC
ncbi:MAG: AAA family ATPase [Burkholderiales bacterium]